MLPSDLQLQTWLNRVDREVLRLGTREHLIAARLLDEATARGFSIKELGDSLASALATDRDTWQEIRRLFDVEFAPPSAVPPRSRWLLLIGGVVLLGVLVAALVLGVDRPMPMPGTDLGPPTDSADLGTAPDMQPQPPDFGCHREPIKEPNRSTTTTVNEPVPVLPMSWLTSLGLALWMLLVCTLGIAFLRLRQYLSKRLAQLAEHEHVAEQRRKQKEEEQRDKGLQQRQALIRQALASGLPTLPHYHIDLQPPFGSDVVEDCATLLGRAFMAQSGRVLDIDRTLAATVEHGGAAQPVFLPGREVRELCVMYDDTTTRPYLPSFLKLVERLGCLGVRLSMYRFSRHPTTLTPMAAATAADGSSHGPPIELADLLRQREGCSLLLFANRLVLRTPTRDLDWPRTLRQAAVCAWLDPDPSLDSERDNDTRTNWELVPRHLPRFPLTADGLLATARYIGLPAEGSRPPTWMPPPALSDPHTARWVDLWLALGALVPDAALNQLEVVRQKLLIEPLPDPRSIGRLLERLTQLLGQSYNPSKSTIKLGAKLRLQLLVKLFWHDRALFRRGCLLLLEMLASEPAGEIDSLVTHETKARRAWYQAGIAMCDGGSTDGLLDSLLGKPCHEFAQEAQQVLRRLSEGEDEEPVLEVVSRPKALSWQTARIPALLGQSTLVAALLPLLLLGGIRVTKYWPGRHVAVTTTHLVARKSLPDEQVICPNRPKVTEPDLIVAKLSPVVVPKRPFVVAMRQTPPPSPQPTLDQETAPPTSLQPALGQTTALPTDIASPPPGPGTVALHLKMVPIKGGQFDMGSPEHEIFTDEQPRHKVHIKMPFCMSETEVTQAQYQAVMGTNPSSFRTPPESINRPVENVTWLDAVLYCNKLSRSQGLEVCYVIQGEHRVKWPKGQGCSGYRLPTEAEWEFAAGAGNKDEVPQNLALFACIPGNAGGETCVVRRNASNTWKLYDMLGNVSEWVWDWYSTQYPGQYQINPTGPDEGSEHVLRGGSFLDSNPSIKSRNKLSPTKTKKSVGFRIARSGESTQCNR